ncbi:MAG TPA: glycosyltransferase [Candidatus Bathyarchaeia archaeon]|nr:glycosyltransferase [Candidatus Bathyarchaeia archaeon]
MRVIIFTWEFPPRIVGQLAHYVNALAAELVKKDVDVHVVTYNNSWVGFHQGTDGIKAYRISDKVRPQINVLTWMLSLNQEAERVTSDIYYSAKHDVNLIDAHDWHFLPAAVTLKKAFGVPFIFSVDSIEPHRSKNMNAPLNVSITNIESLGVTEASNIIVKSEWMKQELKQYYKAPESKVHVVTPHAEGWTDSILKVYEKR